MKDSNRGIMISAGVSTTLSFTKHRGDIEVGGGHGLWNKGDHEKYCWWLRSWKHCHGSYIDDRLVSKKALSARTPEGVNRFVEALTTRKEDARQKWPRRSQRTVEISHSSSYDVDWWVRKRVEMQPANPSQNGEEALPVIVWGMKTSTNILSTYQLLDWILMQESPYQRKTSA